MCLKEECIQFENESGQTLHGILHYAEASQRKSVTVICLNTGLNDMVGWHRLQVKVARFLAAEGYNVLRFDNFGIGESDGELDDGVVVEIFAQIEKGLWAHDAKCAVDYMASRFENERLYYLGYCGGALTAIHAAASDSRIAGIVNIAAPVTLSNMEYLGKKDPWTVQKNVESYKRKLVSLKSIKNFLTGKSDYGEVLRSLVHAARHKLSGRYTYQGGYTKENIDIPNLNTTLFMSFDKLMKTKARPILFYYAGLDNATWGLKKYFLSRYQDKSLWKKSGCSFVELENANHIFSDIESQESLKTDILHWLSAQITQNR